MPARLNWFVATKLRVLLLVTTALVVALLARTYYLTIFVPREAERQRVADEQQQQRTREEWDHFVQTRKKSVYGQTKNLPSVDHVEVFLLGDGRSSIEGFPIRPDNDFATILDQKTVDGEQAQRLAALWRTREFGGKGFMCHEPAYGLRFFAGERKLAETSLCWKCSNCYVFDGMSKYGWLGFTDREAELLKFLEQIIPLPSRRTDAPF